MAFTLSWSVIRELSFEKVAEKILGFFDQIAQKSEASLKRVTPLFPFFRPAPWTIEAGRVPPVACESATKGYHFRRSPRSPFSWWTMALAVGGPPKLNRCRARPTVLNASAPHLTPANNQGTSSMSPGSRLRLLTSLPCFSTKAWFHHPSRVGPILWSKNPFSPAQQAGPARFAPKKYFLPRNPFPAKAKPCGWLRQPWLGTEPGALRKV